MGEERMTISQEEYLKTIYFLLKENKKARVTDIATTLGYSKASVNKAIKLLKEMNMINYESYGDVQLTKEGEKQAKNIVNKHNILKAFLIEVLNVNQETAEEIHPQQRIH